MKQVTLNEIWVSFKSELQHHTKPFFRALTCLLLVWFIPLIVSTICTLEGVWVCRVSVRAALEKARCLWMVVLGPGALPCPSRSWRLTSGRVIAKWNLVFDPSSHAAIKWHLVQEGNLREALSAFKTQAYGNGKYCQPTPCVQKCYISRLRSSALGLPFLFCFALQCLTL